MLIVTKMNDFFTSTKDIQISKFLPEHFVSFCTTLTRISKVRYEKVLLPTNICSPSLILHLFV